MNPCRNSLQSKLPQSKPINAVISTFGPHTSSHSCFYHLTQKTWRKNQSLGLVHLYRENDDVVLVCGMLDTLTFLPIGNVVSGIQYPRENTPDGLEPIIDYFDNTYISGQFPRIRLPTQSDGSVPSIRMPPTFAPGMSMTSQ